jgi:AraC-like DNA-binding protein
MSSCSSALSMIDQSCRPLMSQRLLALSGSVEVELSRRHESQVQIQAAAVDDWWFCLFRGRGSAVVKADSRSLRLTHHALLTLPLQGDSHALNGRWLFPRLGRLGLSPWEDADGVASRGDFHYLVACVPCAQLEDCTDGDIPFGRSIDTSAGAGAVLSSLLRSVAAETMRQADPQALSPLLPHLTRLALSALGQPLRREACERTEARGRIDRAAAYIARHCADPALSAARVARHVGVSTRQLYREFELRQGSYAGQLRTARLELARRCLAAQPSWNITRIAYECGFSSPTLFGRAFREVHGVSPGEYRAAARPGYCAPPEEAAPPRSPAPS